MLAYVVGLIAAVIVLDRLLERLDVHFKKPSLRFEQGERETAGAGDGTTCPPMALGRKTRRSSGAR